MKGTLEFVIESARAVMASLAISHEVDTGFINAEEENLSKYCSKERCTEQITQLRIGKFSFTAEDCATRNYDCKLRFGIDGKEITYPLPSYSYRVINGPMPFSLGCYDGKNHGFADLDLLSLEGEYFELYKNQFLI